MATANAEALTLGVFSGCFAPSAALSAVEGSVLAATSASGFTTAALPSVCMGGGSRRPVWRTPDLPLKTVRFTVVAARMLPTKRPANQQSIDGAAAFC